jgi:hypothetical protein
VVFLSFLNKSKPTFRLILFDLNSILPSFRFLKLVHMSTTKKTYLPRVGAHAALLALFFSPALLAEPLLDKSEFIRESLVTIPVPFTPFGNRVEFNRYGDDGSKCVLDANGVLTWIASDGTVRLLPGTSLAVPMFVTNTECLVWNNRFVDYSNYPSRPKAEIKLFRAAPGSTVVTTQSVTTQGTEVIDTPPVTTTTGTLTFVTTTRLDDGPELLAADMPFVRQADICDMRVYRLTFDAGVQFVRSFTNKIRGESVVFENTVAGPGATAVGYGSDGSIVVKLPDVGVATRLETPGEDQYYWIDSQGRSVKVDIALGVTAPINQVLFTSNTRLVYVDDVDALQQSRRNSSTGNLNGLPTPIALATNDENVLDLANYVRTGDKKYIYTLDNNDNKTVRTYLLGATAVLQSTAVLVDEITSAAVTGTINPTDGSALLVEEDSNSLIWLHSNGHSLVGTGQSKALFVSNEQAVIWENAGTPPNGNGVLPAAIVKHFSRTLTDPAVLTPTVVRSTGSNLLNTSRITPDFDNWFYTTSSKPSASTALLTTYKLASVEVSDIDTDGDGIIDYNELNPPTGIPVTNPNLADTDGDGLSDFDEINKYQTDPTVADTDGDGLSDFDEITTHLTRPLLADTDGDGVSDFLEVAGYRWDTVTNSFVLDMINGFRANPSLRDTDRDGISDGDQVRDGNNPNKPTVVHDRPQIAGEPQTITINQSFTPFGARPATDKTSEDGSVALRDQNGAIIWIDIQNRPILVPNSTLAKTLYVSNTELLVWQNRFAQGYDQVGSNSEVVLHRRNEVGEVESTEPVVIPGTLLETSFVSAGPLGFTLVGSERIPTEPEAESRLTALGDFAIVTTDVDQWDRQIFTQYRVTLDGQPQQLNQLALLVPKVGGNLTTAKVTAAGSDGALFVNLETAGNTRVDETLGEVFFSAETGVWITWQPNAEKIEFFSFAEKPSPVYVANDRLVIEDKEAGTVVDYRKQGVADATVAGAYPLSKGSSLLALNSFTRAGMDPLFYIASYSGIQLHSLDVGLLPIGNAVQVPGSIQANTQFVRNPADGSLLIRGEGSTGVIWIPSEVNFITGEILGLSRAIVLPSSAQGAPLFVDANQAVVWMNSTAPLGAGGVVSPAQIAHFSIGTDFRLKKTDLVPPIEGRFVAQAPGLTPDPFDDGWFITTFANTSARSTVSRTYRLRTAFDIDTDGDGLPDLLENQIGTGLSTGDSDGDGLTDGDEIYPYYIIDGSFTFAEAIADAILRGGRVAHFTNRDDYSAMVRRFSDTNVNSFWLGATDGAVEGTWRWGDGSLLNNANWASPGALNWAGFYAQTLSTVVPWAAARPNNANNADGLILRGDKLFEDRPLTERRGYVFEYTRTDPKVADTDGDGLSDSNEYSNGTDPTVVNTFAGVPELPAPGPVVPFASAAIATSSQGLLYDPEQGHIGSLLMKVSKTGSFTYSYQGLDRTIKASGRGVFSTYGAYSGGRITGLSDIKSLNMQYVQQAGEWVILGVMERDNGKKLGFELRTAKYGKTNPYPAPGAVTMAFALPESAPSAPLGDGVATGGIDRTGLVKLNIVMPNGARATSSGPILKSDDYVVNALATTGRQTTLIGAIHMTSDRAFLDYDGTLRLYAQSSSVGGQSSGAVDQQRSVMGSAYRPASKGLSPYFENTLSGWNTRFNLIDGDFDGVSEIGAWGASNKINIPGSPVRSSLAVFAPKTGLISYGHTRTDAVLGVKTTASGFGVVLQKSEQMRGYYVSPLSTGRFTVTENNGSVPSLTSISPINKMVPVAATEYFVQVNTTGAWEVKVPLGATVNGVVTDPVTGEQIDVLIPWVTAEVVSGGAGLAGNGNGVVKVTVQENTTGLWFYSTLEIAGIVQNITQDYEARR